MHKRRLRVGYTVIELLTTIAALVIILALMMSLTHHVRASSADDITKNLLRQMDHAMDRYARINGGAPPDMPPFITSQAPGADEAALARRAEINNESVVRLLKVYHVFPAEQFDDLSIAYYNGVTVRDAWGSPIVFMPTMDPAIGMSAKGWFFFSAGPDGRYTTKFDNIYSYELPGLDQTGQ